MSDRIESMPPLTDAGVAALVETAGRATPGPCEARFVPGEIPTACCHFAVVSVPMGIETCRVWTREDVEFLASANPAAILSWSARDAAQVARIAELEARLATARETALREAAACSEISVTVMEMHRAILSLIPSKDPTDAE